jgi:adenylosuccinate synthase
MDAAELREQLQWTINYKNVILEKLYNLPPLDPEVVIDHTLEYADRLRPHVIDTSLKIYDAIQRRRNILFEGAQGTLLDLDHGLSLRDFLQSCSWGSLRRYWGRTDDDDRVIGVAKAYTTRVGEGPFPTELDGEMGETLCDRGAEFGTTTGRKRRCGWFDAVIGRYAVRINGWTVWQLLNWTSSTSLRK